MSISSCRCCSLLTRPTRLRLNHLSAVTRSLHVSPIVGEVKKLPKVDWAALKPQAPIAPPPRPAGGQIRGSGGSGSGAGGRGGFGMGGRGGGETGGNRGGQRNNDQRRGSGFGMEGGNNRGDTGGGGQRGGFGQRNEQQRDKGPPMASNFGIKRGGGGSDQKAELPSRDWSASRHSRNDVGSSAGPSRRSAETKAPAVAVESGEAVESEAVEEIVYDENDQSDLARQSRRRRGQLSAQSANDSVDDFTFSRGRAPKVDPYARKGKYEQQNDQNVLREERDRIKEQKAAERRQLRAKEERQVMIPTNVTVSRLATIFGKKLGELQPCENSCMVLMNSTCAVEDALRWAGRGQAESRLHPECG